MNTVITIFIILSSFLGISEYHNGNEGYAIGYTIIGMLWLIFKEIKDK